MSERPAATGIDVVIVGAGFAGLYQLWRLRRLGFRARVFEAGAGAFVPVRSRADRAALARSFHCRL